MKVKKAKRAKAKAEEEEEEEAETSQESGPGHRIFCVKVFNTLLIELYEP